QVLRRGMAKRPEERFRTAAEFVVALKPAVWPARLAETVAQPSTSRRVLAARTPVVLVVDDGEANRELIEACLAGIDCRVATAVDRVELVARVSSALRLKGVYDSLDGAEQVIFALAAAVEAKDPFTEAHTQRVAESARAVGAWLGLAPSHLDSLFRGGLIHDIGKIGIPDAILLKPGPLDADEEVTMHLHPIIGETIVRPLRSGAGILPIIRSHHEHWDGNG